MLRRIAIGLVLALLALPATGQDFDKGLLPNVVTTPPFKDTTVLRSRRFLILKTPNPKKRPDFGSGSV